MKFDVIFFLCLFNFQVSSSPSPISPCAGSDVKLTIIANRCYWCIGEATFGLGEKNCEQDNGTIFSAQSLEDAHTIKERLNINATTDVFLGAIFNDVNGTQDYDWLSAPGNYSELLTNISSLELGNKTVPCLSVADKIRAVGCEEEMSATICMRDITLERPCFVDKPDNNSVTSITLTAIDSTIPSIGQSGHSAIESFSKTSDDSINIENQTQGQTVKPFTEALTNSSDITLRTQVLDLTKVADMSTLKSSVKQTPKASTQLGTIVQESTTTSSTPLKTSDAPISLNNSTTILRPGVQGADLTAGHINNGVQISDQNSSQLNLSEKIDHVPGANGSVSVIEILDSVLSRLKRTDITTISSINLSSPSTTSEIKHCKDQDNNFTDADAHLGDIILVKGVNGPKATNFSSVLDHVLGHKIDQVTKKPCIPMKPDGDEKKNTEFQNQVKEVKFQVSPDINLLPPWRGDPNLIPYGESLDIMAVLQNISSDLQELQETKEVTNGTLERLAATIETVVTHSRIQHVSQNVKDTLFMDIMTTAEELVARVKSPCETLHIKTDILEIDSKLIEVEKDSNDSYLPVKSTAKQAVKLSRTIFETNVDTRVSTIEYKKLDTIIPSSEMHVSSHVMSVSVQRTIGNITKTVAIKEAKGAVILILETFLLPNAAVENVKIRQSDDRNWSTSGCELVDRNSTHSTCTCDHLTNFAVLVMYMDTEKVSVQSQQVLLTLTTVGCSLSIACLSMTLIAFAYLRMLSNEKILIHFNLSLALAMAQIVFVSSSDAHTNPVACKVVAILLHFFFMASFTWMLVEGVALYLLCTKGFMNHRDMRVKYFLLGWGVPSVIVLVSLAAKFPDYGHGPQYSCWLSVQDGLIWAFLGPMLAVVVLNVFVMGLVVRKFLTLKAVAQKTDVAKLRGSLRAMMTLLPLLGLTWLLSLLVPFSVVFHYFFVIINTLQGMCIFFLHCICNDELRKKFQAKRRRWSSPTITGSDSDTRYTVRRKTGV